MSVQIVEANTPALLRDFVNVQFDIYRNSAYWVPPIKKDEVKVLQAKGNPAMRFCDFQCWIALKNGKAVGRIAAIINHKHNEKTGEIKGRFSRTEFIDDPEVSAALFETAENWLKEQGITEVQGPLGFTNLDHQGMLVEGFDHLPSAASEYHHPYYKEHLENLGYQKEIDWLEFRLFLDGVPEKAQRVADIIKTRNKLRVQHFKSTSELKPYANRIFELLNEAFKDLFSVVHLDKQMIDYYVNRYIPMLNPRFVKMVFDQDENLVAFVIALPSLSKGLQKAKGKLFPFGWWHIKQALEKPDVVDLMLTGVLPEYQGKGVVAIAITEAQKVMEEHGVTAMETTGIFETNTKAIQNWKNYDHIQHKRKRCWKKSL